MKYDDLEVSKSYNYERSSVSRGKIGKHKKASPLDVAVIGSISAVVISTTVLISRLMSTGVIDTIMSAIR